MKFCEQCGAKLDDDAKFCTVCGAKTESINEDTTYTNYVSPAPNANKKLIILPIIVVVGIVVFALTYLFFIRGYSTRKELLKYINQDIKELSSVEKKLLKSYTNVTGSNYVNDETTYKEFVNSTLPLAGKLNELSIQTVNNITDKEILEVHKIYINYTSKYLAAVNMVTLALENQNTSQVLEANEILNEANNLAIDYRKALYELAEKYNITITKE